MVLKLVKQNKIKQCFLIQFLALCRYLPCFPIWGPFPFLVPLLYFENLSLPCSLFSGLIESPFDIHPLDMNVSWLYFHPLRRASSVTTSWSQFFFLRICLFLFLFEVKFIYSVPISPCYTKLWLDASTIPEYF